MDIPTDAAVPLLQINAKDIQVGEVLAFTWQASDGTASGDVFAPKPWKSYDLRFAGLTHTVAQAAGRYDLTLTAQALAPFVAVEADQPGRFSANAFALFPGHPAIITFTPAGPGPAPVFTLRDLYSATCGPL
jgi:beta-mannosidase